LNRVWDIHKSVTISLVEGTEAIEQVLGERLAGVLDFRTVV
jgi:hypothetical protein